MMLADVCGFQKFLLVRKHDRERDVGREHAPCIVTAIGYGDDVMAGMEAPTDIVGEGAPSHQTGVALGLGGA
jgi:hypothetical protein